MDHNDCSSRKDAQYIQRFDSIVSAIQIQIDLISFVHRTVLPVIVLPIGVIRRAYL